MLEVYHNPDNQQLFMKMSRDYGISGSGVPVLFIGSSVLRGEVEIRNQLDDKIQEEEVRLRSCNTSDSMNPATPDTNCTTVPTRMTVPVVIFSALADSINPCAFSVLIFLLVSVVALGSRRRILLVGGTYISAVFLLYLLSGIGLLSIVSVFSGFSIWLSLAGATIVIILGLISVIDAVRNKEEFLLGISASRKPVIDQYIRAASLPAAFVLGILVGLFELPCTGGIYLAILGLISRTFTFMEGLPYLVLYNVVFILPLIVILLLAAYGLPPEQANTWRIQHRRKLRFVIGLAMIALGIIILSGWIG